MATQGESGAPRDLDFLGPVREDEATAAGIPAPPSRWKTRILLPATILVVVLGLLAYTAREALWPAVDVRAVQAIARKAGAAVGTVTVQAPGWVEPDPFFIAVSALTEGVVRTVDVLEGQPVKAGQVVARLVDEDARLALARAEAEVGRTTAELAAAEARLRAAQADWDHPIERTRAVSSSQAMLDQTMAELRQLAAEIDAEEARLAERRETLRRTDRYYDELKPGGMELIRAKSSHDAQAAALDATRARKAVLEAQAAARRAELVAAEENLRLRISEARALEEGKAAVSAARAALEMARAQRDEAKLRLARTEIRSPVDGVVMRRLVEPGARVSLDMETSPTSGYVLRLYDPAKLQVRVDIPLADAAKVSLDQPALVTVDVLPDRTFEGRLTRFVHEADIQKNTLQVKVAIVNPSPELKPEMLARVKFLTPAAPAEGEASQRVFIPAEAFRGQGQQGVVWVARPGSQTAHQRSVVAGAGRVAGWVEIVSGLNPGDWVIVGDAGGLSEGCRVRITGEGIGETE